MNIYLAGKMTGIKHFNFPAFYKAAKELRNQGHVVFNPAEMDMKTWGNHKNINRAFERDRQGMLRICLGKDTAWICKHADAVAILPGWQGSKGVAAEKALAKALGIKVIYLK